MSFTFFRHNLLLMLLLASVLFGAAAPLKAQNDLNCFQLFFPVVQAAPGDTVCVPLMVRDFDDVFALQFGVTWDGSALKLIDREVLNPINQGSTTNLFPEKLLFGWYEPFNQALSLPDSAIIIKLYFRVQPGTTGMQRLTIGDLDPFSVFEALQLPTGSLPFVFLPLAQQYGGVLVGSGQPSSMAITSSCARNATCTSPSGEASIVVEGGTPPYSYEWSGPSNFTANTAAISNVFPGEYQVTITDAVGNMLFGSIRVGSDSTSLAATVTTQAAVCGQSNGCAAIVVQGGVAPYNFLWPSGISAQSENCALPQGNYTVTVKDANGCEGLASFYIADSSDLHFEITTSSINGCNGGGSAQIIFDVPTPGMQVLWATGDTTLQLENLSQGLYFVTITSPGGCTTTDFAVINDNPGYNWSPFLYAECAPNSTQTGNLYLNFDGYGNLPFPCTVTWSNGTVHTIHQISAGNIIDSLVNVPVGIYSVSLADPNGCSFLLNTVLDCAKMPTPPPASPAFYVKDEFLNAQHDVDSCIGVFARHFNGIREVSFSLENKNGTITNLQSLELPGLEIQDFTFSSDGTTLGVHWESPTPVTLSPDALLFEVCYTSEFTSFIGEIEFGSTPVEAVLRDSQGVEMAFLGKAGRVFYDYLYEITLATCDYGITPPDCLSDGNYRVVLAPCDTSSYFEVAVYEKNGTQLPYNGGISALLFLSEGEHRFIAAQQDFLFDYFFVKIPSTTDGNECVWPGDADNNGATNHHDLLYLGLAYNTLGNQRPNASEAWFGQASADWPEAIPASQVNFKNIDCNGDGIINAADTMAIVNNWAKVINPTVHNAFAAAPGNNGMDVTSLAISADTLFEGQSAVLPLLLGTQNAPIDSVYGFAFSVSYDPAVIKDNIRFVPGNSWFADEDKYLVLQKNFPEQQRLDVAITRIDGVPASGWGAIGNFYIIIEDNIFGDPNPSLPPDNTLKTLVYFTETQSVHTFGSTGILGDGPAELVIKRASVGVKESINVEPNINVFPNPVYNLLNIDAGYTSVLSVEISDVTGNVVKQLKGNASQWQIPVHDLPAGTFFVRLLTETGVITKKCNKL